MSDTFVTIIKLLQDYQKAIFYCILGLEFALCFVRLEKGSFVAFRIFVSTLVNSNSYRKIFLSPKGRRNSCADSIYYRVTFSQLPEYSASKENAFGS